VTRRILIRSQIGKQEVKEHAIPHPVYVYIILWYDQNSNTWLEPKFWVCEIVEMAKKLRVQCGLVFWWGETRCNGCSSVLTQTQNWTVDLESLLTLVWIGTSLLRLTLLSNLCHSFFVTTIAILVFNLFCLFTALFTWIYYIDIETVISLCSS